MNTSRAVLEHNGFQVNQLVYDLNKTLCRIIYIEIDSLLEKYDRDFTMCRIAILNKNGTELATCSAMLSTLTALEIPDNFIKLT